MGASATKPVLPGSNVRQDLVMYALDIACKSEKVSHAALYLRGADRAVVITMHSSQTKLMAVDEGSGLYFDLAPEPMDSAWELLSTKPITVSTVGKFAETPLGDMMELS